MTNKAAHTQIIPDSLGEMSLEALREDYRRRLFEHYLPFWEKGGCDHEYGGFICELNDDGSACGDEKFSWYQGRGIWTYAFLYNNFGRQPRWLEVAAKARDFLVEHMYAGEGNWIETVRRDGTVVAGVGTNIYGPLHIAEGLLEYYLAARDPRDLELAKTSISAAMRIYDDPAYFDAYTTQYTSVPLPEKGIRVQGQEMVLVWALTQYLRVCEDPELERLQRRFVDHVLQRFWNEEYGIANEYLQHDYSRVPGAEGYMFPGHSLEVRWMLFYEAVRRKDRAMFDRLKREIRRLIEMCWDYVFEGWGDGGFSVFATPKHCQGADYSVKTMWAHAEMMVACMTVLEYTGELWAKEWYDRVRAFTLKTMPVAAHGVWRQAVDRFGNDLKRVGISVKRKDNYHQVRMLMLGLLSLDRMLANGRKPTPFPE